MSLEVKFCGCVRNGKGELGQRLRDLWDEVIELAEAKSVDEFWDEWSDIVFGLGRLVGYFKGVGYVRVWGDEKCVKKKIQRMLEYGCTRSKRHLFCGICPSM